VLSSERRQLENQWCVHTFTYEISGTVSQRSTGFPPTIAVLLNPVRRLSPPSDNVLNVPSRNVLLTRSPWRGEQARTTTDDTTRARLAGGAAQSRQKTHYAKAGRPADRPRLRSFTKAISAVKTKPSDREARGSSASADCLGASSIASALGIKSRRDPALNAAQLMRLHHKPVHAAA